MGIKGEGSIPVNFNKVNGSFDIGHNRLKSLKGSPKHVDESFICSFNLLTSLEHCPSIINGNFLCAENNLPSLNYGPKHVVGTFMVSNNKNLKSLIGGPESVSGDYLCSGCDIRNFEGFPEFYEGVFCDFSYNPVYEIYKMFGMSKAIYWINEFEAIQGDKIIANRMYEVFYMTRQRKHTSL